MYHNVHCSSIYNTRTWKQPKCPSTGEWIKTQDPSLGCLQKMHFRTKDTQRQSERMEKDIS